MLSNETMWARRSNDARRWSGYREALAHFVLALVHKVELRDYWDERVSIANLARRGVMLEAHFCRPFSGKFSLPPHHDQMVLRVATRSLC